MKNIAICFSTKDRVAFSKTTLPALLKENDKFDLFIVDGSQTEEGRAYALDLNTRKGIAGVHCNVTGGADVAIVYALSFMLERGYEYLGLVENDVLLSDGWYERISDMLLSTTNVGSVSARCYEDRVLEYGKNAALMSNIGAGMVVFTRPGAEAVLDYYRNGSLNEYKFWPHYFYNKAVKNPHEITDPNAQYQMTADWFFESSMMARGLISVACVPTMARSTDNTPEVLQLDIVSGNSILRKNTTPVCFGNYDPGAGTFPVQPHQIFKALPDAFTGDWKITWAKHNGPFGMRTTTSGELNLPVYGSRVNLLLDIKEGATVEAWLHGVKIGVLNKSAGYCCLQFGEPKQREILLKFSGDVTVMTLVFDCLQNWFKDGYALRYKDLEKYL